MRLPTGCQRNGGKRGGAPPRALLRHDADAMRRGEVCGNAAEGFGWIGLMREAAGVREANADLGQGGRATDQLLPGFGGAV
jgi:hypothetical protein